MLALSALASAASTNMLPNSSTMIVERVPRRALPARIDGDHLPDAARPVLVDDPGDAGHREQASEPQSREGRLPRKSSQPPREAGTSACVGREAREEIGQKDEAEHPVDDQDDIVDGGTKRRDGQGHVDDREHR